MDASRLAAHLDGRPEYTYPCLTFRRDMPYELWVAYLYGYRLESYGTDDIFSRSGSWICLRLDPSPEAQARAAWMRRPDLRPGVPAPVPWQQAQPGQWPLLWTPPGWPPGWGPTPPPVEQMPQLPVSRWYERVPPRGLLVIAAGLVVFRVLAHLGVGKGATPGGGLSPADLIVLLLVAACLTGAWLSARARRVGRKPG
ncbi:hypothetical protein [Peterkaempfera bronchialis]|uniref:hypothetical protein n=1 Tax=Peterkaempfera bronchialis TaxID=2126346 RepID=UPI003C30A636